MEYSSDEGYPAEPLTPSSRLFLHPKLDLTLYFAIGFQNPLDIEAIKSEISNSIMVKLPRFSSLLVSDRNGKQVWVRTHVDIDKHMIFHHHHNTPTGAGSNTTRKDEEDIVNDYLAEFAVLSPLSTDKPLWEMHVLVGLKCLIVRVHHSLGDGISLLSMFWAMGRPAENWAHEDHHHQRSMAPSGDHRCNWMMMKGLWGSFKSLGLTMYFGAQYIARSLWLKDDKSLISAGCAGVEFWPRKSATARFSLEDMKTVKTSINPNATINDVLTGMIWYGLSKYLDLQSPHVRDGLRITMLSMVNLREQPGLQEMSTLMEKKSKSRWGNKVGAFLLPIYYQKGGLNPLDYLKKAKQMMDQRKKTKEAQFSYAIVNLTQSCFGQKITGRLYYNFCCNTGFTLSNMPGPPEQITISNNPVTYIRISPSGVPYAIQLEMVSYAGMVDLQILVAKDIIPDPNLLAKCFQDALMEMKDAALENNK